MALKRCRECETEVSTEADKCPQCGVPHPTGKSTAEKVEDAGEGLQRCGCLLTLLITVPFVVLLFASMCA